LSHSSTLCPSIPVRVEPVGNRPALRRRQYRATHALHPLVLFWSILLPPAPPAAHPPDRIGRVDRLLHRPLHQRRLLSILLLLPHPRPGQASVSLLFLLLLLLCPFDTWHLLPVLCCCRCCSRCCPPPLYEQRLLSLLMLISTPGPNALCCPCGCSCPNHGKLVTPCGSVTFPCCPPT